MRPERDYWLNAVIGLAVVAGIFIAFWLATLFAAVPYLRGAA